MLRGPRVAGLAKCSPELVFTSLAHLIDLEWLLEAYRRTRKDGAVGVDGQTAADYDVDLMTNLQSLLDRVQSGTYRAPPVRRVQIPKGNSSETRPIGIPTFEDKLLQRAVLMLLEPIFEQEFSDSSYGFRPGRSTHQAIDAKKASAYWPRVSRVIDAARSFDRRIVHRISEQVSNGLKSTQLKSETSANRSLPLGQLESIGKRKINRPSP